MPDHLSPGIRAEMAGQIDSALDVMRTLAARHDGEDIIEAGIDMTFEILGFPGVTPSMLAAAAATLALRLHRGGERRG